MTEKIAIFGGAFNPPTRGHELLIKEIFKKTNIDKIIIVPDGFRLDKDYGINESDRNNMIQIFIKYLKNKGLNIDCDNFFLEGKNKKDTTTYQVDKYFIKKLGIVPNHIFGTDISGEIKNWSGNPDKYIQKKLKKIFYPRKGYKFINKDLENYIIVDTNNTSELSSTKVRQQIKKNKNISDFVIGDIKKYIENNKLYK